FQFRIVDDVLEEADEQAPEEDHRIEGGSAELVRVEGRGQRGDEREIEHLCQPLVEVALRDMPVQIGRLYEQRGLRRSLVSLAHRVSSFPALSPEKIRRTRLKTILSSWRLLRLYPASASLVL